jgi:hypothetical protein
MIATRLNLTPQGIAALRQRRQDGETYQTLAREAGLAPGELWDLLYPSQAGQAPAAKPKPAPGGEPLTERYRPRTLDQLRGQPHVVRALKRLAANPRPGALLFEGETGTGKTSAALGLAAALGCDVGQGEFGGVVSMASGEQTAEAVRETFRRMWNIPMFGSGWKVVIANEADRMSPQAETIWLDRLESIPSRTVIVFTTNAPEKLTQRFRDRCTRLTFRSGEAMLRMDALGLLEGIWRAEIGDVPDMAAVARAVAKATESGSLSFRRAVQYLAAEILERE